MTFNLKELPTKIHEQACHWAMKMRSADCTEAERKAFDDWLNESQEHRVAYRQAEGLWCDLGGLSRLATGQLDEARSYIGQAKRNRRRTRARLLAFAASLLLTMGVARQAWLWSNIQNYSTSKGEQKHVVLADGSEIDLNTDTALRVRYGWSTRTVWLDRGEALFSVVHDENQEFEVQAQPTLIRDIGTRFDVFREADRVSVAVLEGEVEIASIDSSGTARVKAGYQIAHDAQGQLTQSAPIDIESSAAWREGKLSFKSLPLGKVIAQLSRYHDVELTLRDRQLEMLPVSGVFPTHDLKVALDTMAAALPLKVTRVDGGHVLLERKEDSRLR